MDGDGIAAFTDTALRGGRSVTERPTTRFAKRIPGRRRLYRVTS
jgi:hypothetical protein